MSITCYIGACYYYVLHKEPFIRESVFSRIWQSRILQTKETWFLIDMGSKCTRTPCGQNSNKMIWCTIEVSTECVGEPYFPYAWEWAGWLELDGHASMTSGFSSWAFLRCLCPVGTFWTFNLYVGGVVRLKIKIFVKLCHPHSQLKLEIENSDSLPVLLSRINCPAGYVYQTVGLPVESRKII